MFRPIRARKLTVYGDVGNHFRPLLVSSRAVVGGCAVAIGGLIVLAIAMIPSTVTTIAICGAIVIATTSAFFAGNSYRLRDIRARRGNELRDQPEATKARAELPPRETIALRLRVAAYGVAIGVLSLAATTVIGFVSGADGVGEWTAVVAILGLVFTALIFVAATYARPLD